jgi:MSHA biogenesis protein MshN
MSILNKMLQDLEARQFQTDELNTDYRPPQKKQSKLWILFLLILAIAAISFTYIYNRQLFDERKVTKVAASVDVLPISTEEARKVIITPPKTQLQGQVHSSKDDIERVNNANVLTDVLTDVLTNELISPNKNTMAADNLISLQIIETQDQQLETQNTDELGPTHKVNNTDNTQITTEQTSSFKMSGSSQKNNINSLKQRIGESLKNDNFDIPQSLLVKLLAIDPNNIKARKKSASLLFSKGNYEQSRQLLIKGINLHPAQSDLRLMLARLYIVQKKPLKAMTLLSEFQPSSNNPVEYLAYRAALAQQLKQTALANTDYLTLTSIEYSNAKWWLGLAITRDKLGEINEALQAYNKAKSLRQLDSSVNEFIQQRITVLAGAQ